MLDPAPMLPMERDAAIYDAKARASLTSAEHDDVGGRYDSCASRCYYACFQAAIAALVRDGIWPNRQWSHAFVQAQFAGVLIDRRKRYPASLRGVLADARELRELADYRPVLTSQKRAERALRQDRSFVNTVRDRAGESE